MLHTHADAMEPLAFLQEAIKFPHLGHGHLCPPILGNYVFDFFTKRRYVPWFRGKVEYSLCKSLKGESEIFQRTAMTIGKHTFEAVLMDAKLIHNNLFASS